MPDATPLRILIVANKSWECEPVVNVLSHKDSRPSSLTALRRGYDPLERRPQGVPAPAYRGVGPPRPRLSLTSSTTDPVEVWCIEDWMCTERTIQSPAADGAAQTIRPGSSSSFEKLTGSLPTIARHAFSGAAPGLVIAMGTAGIPSDETLNGCVAMGSRCYVRDPWADARPDEIAKQVARFGPMLTHEIAAHAGEVILSPRLSPELFSNVAVDARFAAEGRFLSVPVNPAVPARILAGHGYAALSTVNINDYDDYVWADEETLSAFALSVRQREIGSMETTHALIRLAWPETPFLFVSALTDRVPMFNAEVTPRKYAQNFAAAHNAGQAIAQLLPELSRLNRDGGLWVRQYP